jgi:hypothetical protein
MEEQSSVSNERTAKRIARQRMIHGYQVIWGTYGFWLPNDPRDSWSDFVGSWELVRFGKATKSLERLDRDSRQWALWRAAAL